MKVRSLKYYINDDVHLTHTMRTMDIRICLVTGFGMPWGQSGHGRSLEGCDAGSSGFAMLVFSPSLSCLPFVWDPRALVMRQHQEGQSHARFSHEVMSISKDLKETFRESLKHFLCPPWEHFPQRAHCRRAAMGCGHLTSSQHGWTIWPALSSVRCGRLEGWLWRELQYLVSCPATWSSVSFGDSSYGSDLAVHVSEGGSITVW